MDHFSIISSDSEFGNFCWPSVARLKDGRLITVCSGHRLAHVCPFGKVVASVSDDDGKTWSEPITLIDTPLDDRDAGITPLGDGFVVTTFNNTRAFQIERLEIKKCSERQEMLIRTRVAEITDAEEEEYFGSSCYVFDANMKELFHTKLPLSGPHGMSVMNDGTLMYVGRTAMSACIGGDSKDGIGVIFTKDGKNFSDIKWIEMPTDKYPAGAFFCEPYGIQLKDGTILVHIRVEKNGGKSFITIQSVSKDGGETFSIPEPLNIPDTPMYGAPPHLYETGDGTVVLSYGYRLPPFGQRARISRDGGVSWSREIVLRDDSISSDLGYPATVELRDGSLLTVYYQIPTGKENRAILATKWNIAEFDV